MDFYSAIDRSLPSQAPSLSQALMSVWPEEISLEQLEILPSERMNERKLWKSIAINYPPKVRLVDKSSFAIRPVSLLFGFALATTVSEFLFLLRLISRHITRARLILSRILVIKGLSTKV